MVKSVERGPDADIVEMIRKRVGFNELRPERYLLEDSALVNLAYWSGKQSLYYENRQFLDATLWAEPDEVRYQINLIRSRVLNAVARVINVNAEFRARPESSSARDRETAKMSDKVFDHIRIVTDFEYVRSMATLWACITGSAYLKCMWDPLIGEPTRFYKADGRTSAVIPEIMLTPAARAEKDRDGLFEDWPSGDLSVACESPFAVYQDTSSRDAGIRGCHWIASRHWVDRDRVAEMWDIDPKDIPTEEMQGGVRNYDEAIAFMSAGTGIQPFQWTIPEDKIGRRVQYTEMWERPSRDYPRGRRICLAGRMVLNRNRKGGMDNPYAGDRSGWAHLPYVKVDWITHPGRFWGASMVEDLIGPQYYLNRARSLKAKFMETFGLPNTFIGDATQLDTDSMAAGGGKIYKMSEQSIVRVQQGPVPMMPREVAEFSLEALSDLNSAASQSEIEASALPGQMRSGAAIRAMNEDRYMPLSVPAKLSVRAVRDAGRVLLAIGKLYYGNNRLLRYMGEDNEWIVEAFNGADLVTDIQVIGEPSVTDTVAAGRAEMLDAVQSGAFNPQFDAETRELILSGLYYNTSDEFMRRKLQAKRHAESVIQKVMADPARWAQTGYPVMEYQNHEVEARELQAFMYTQEFERLDPMTKSILTKYWKDCTMYVQLAMQAQLQLQASLKGSPGEKGQASQPAS